MSDPKNLSATGDWQPEPDEKVPQEVLSPADPNASPTVSLGAIRSYHAQPGQEIAADQKGIPKIIGRYRVEKILGEGGFGVVYLAHDDELKRRAAIKVPQAHRIAKPEDAEA